MNKKLERVRSEWKFAVGTLLLLVLAGWVRFHILEIHRDNREIHESSTRTLASMAEARNILRGETSKLFPGASPGGGYQADDVGFALYIAAIWSLVEDRTLESIQNATVYLDLFALLVFILAVRRAFDPATGLTLGLLYALYLPIPIQIAHANNHVLVVQFSILLIGLILLFPRCLWGQIVGCFLAALLFLFANLVRSVFAPFAFLIGFFLFLKYGRRRGTLLALLFLGLAFGGNLGLKWVMGSPSHQVWHALFVGLGEFPNPYGLRGYDTEGNEEAGRTQPGIDMYRTTPEYLEVIKHRTLSLIDEDRGFYLNTLLRRVQKVLTGNQHWFFVGFGPKVETAQVIDWVLFLFGLAGMVLSFRNRLWDGFLVFMGWLYFSLCVTPLLTSLSSYYLAGSALLLPFPAYFLASLRIGRGTGEQAPADCGWNSEWRVERWVAGFVLAGLAASVVGTAGFLAYARSDSRQWKKEILANLEADKPIRTWGPNDFGKISTDRETPAITGEVVLPGRPHLLDASIRVERGRLGLEIRDSEGQPLSPATYTAGPGENRCLLGWTPTAPGEVRLHVWEAAPRNYPDYYEEDEGAFMKVSYDHHGLVDHAKLEFFPTNQVEVSASFFPNGHPTMPYRLNKKRVGGTETSRIPGYWAASSPAWTRLRFAEARAIDRVVCRFPARGHPVDPPTLWLKHKAQPNHRPPTGLVQEIGAEGREVRFTFNRMEADSVELRFETAGNELGIVYVQDVSIPDPAEFEIGEVVLRVREEDGSRPPHPSSLSFLMN